MASELVQHKLIKLCQNKISDSESQQLKMETMMGLVLGHRNKRMMHLIIDTKDLKPWKQIPI